MGEVPLFSLECQADLSSCRSMESLCLIYDHPAHMGTSAIRKRPPSKDLPTKDPPSTLGVGLW